MHARWHQRPSPFYQKNHTLALLPPTSRCVLWITSRVGPPVSLDKMSLSKVQIWWCLCLYFILPNSSSSAFLDFKVSVFSVKGAFPASQDRTRCPYSCSRGSGPFCSPPCCPVTDSATSVDSTLLNCRHCLIRCLFPACLLSGFWRGKVLLRTKCVGSSSTTATFVDLAFSTTAEFPKFLNDEIKVNYTTC